MKNIISVVLLSLILFSCGNDSGEVQVSSTPEEMGEELFDAIKNEDAAIVRTYIGVESDIEQWLSNSSLSEKKAEKKKKKLMKKVESLDYNLAKTLAKMYEEKIDWENTSYDWIDYKNFEKDSVTGADIYIVFSEGKQQYEIKLKNCYPSKRGWVLFDEISFKGARK